MKTHEMVIGIHFLHHHPMKQERTGLDRKHVIVDRDEWEKVCRFFNNARPTVVNKLVNS